MPGLSNISRVFFIGIGGIGMSGLARYFKFMGKEVFGYDKTRTVLTEKLESEGISVHYEDKIEYIPEHIDLVIYTPAIPKYHTQLNYFLSQGYDLFKRSQVLGMLSREYKVMAVAGTHGKTTTSTLLTHLLITGGVDCTAFLGGISENLQSNFIFGHSEWMVVEADEYDRSFLTLYPANSIITSADPDHLDIYGDENEMHKSFIQFASQNDKNGTVFIKQGISIVDEVKKNVVHTVTYGIDTGEVFASNINLQEGSFHFDYNGQNNTIADLMISLPGRHNIENAVAAVSLAILAGVDENSIREALANFKGIKRRFEFIHKGKVIYIDDYAHHPGELAAAIQAARELFPGKKITGIFQPHLFSRTRDFVEGFAEELDKLDQIWLMDIYPAREEPIPGVSSRIILNLMKNHDSKILSRTEILESVHHLEDEVLMTLGAGDIDTLIEPIRQILKAKEI